MGGWEIAAGNEERTPSLPSHWPPPSHDSHVALAIQRPPISSGETITNNLDKNGSGPLECKPDWPQAQRRWTAFWDRQATDRPLMDVRARLPHDMPPPMGAPTSNPPICAPPLPPPETMEARYLDADYVVRRWQRAAAATWYGGDAVPTVEFLMGGYALGCDARVRFAEDTVWHPRMISGMDEPIPWDPGPDDPWRRKLDRVLEALLDAADGKFLVGLTGQVPLNDLIMLLRGTDEFLMELAEDPGLCARRLAETFPRSLEIIEHIRLLIGRRQYGLTMGYPGLWSRTPFAATQSDMSCMISSALFEQWVARELDLLAEHFPFLWYHLDGPGAVRHLPALLGRPYIRCIQYVPGSGAEPNGPAWMALYRQVQAAGRCLDLDVPLEHVEHVVRGLRPEGLLVRTRAKTPEQGEELLRNAAAWAGSRARTS